MKNIFKKVFIALGSLLFLLLIVGNLFFFSKSKDNKALLDKNEALNKQSKELISRVDTLQKDKLKLMNDLAKREVEIVIKEKIVYKDGTLIIPPDYENLKTNYTTLSSLYKEKSNMYDISKKQNESDYSTIEELKNKLDEVNKINDDLAYQVAHPRTKFFKQFAVIGATYSNDGIKYNGGYQVLLMDRISLEAVLQYPDPSVTILLGIKLNG